MMNGLRAQNLNDLVDARPTYPHSFVPPSTAAGNIVLSWNHNLSHSPYPFVRNLDIHQIFAQRVHGPDWVYSNRRCAQQILPFLYLGPLQAAKDAIFLHREQITLTVAVRNVQGLAGRMLEASLRVAESLHVATEVVDVKSDQSLMSALPKTINVINTHLGARVQPDGSTIGKVLVHCETGNERSAGLVVAYLMYTLDLPFIPAVQLVQASRFCISLDDSLKFVLREYETILQAARDVQSSTSTLPLLPPNETQRRKRHLDPDEDIEKSGDIEVGREKSFDH